MNEQALRKQSGRWDRAGLWALELCAGLFSAGYATYGSVGLLLVTVAAGITERRVPWDSSPLDRPLWVFAAVLLLSAFASDFRPVALAAVGQLLLLLVLGYGMTYRILTRSPLALAPLTVVWLVGALAAAAIGIYEFFAISPALLGPGARTHHITHTAFGTTLAIASLVSLGQAMARRSHRITFLALVSAVMSTAGLILTNSRGAWLGWEIGATVLAVVALRRKVSGPSLAAVLGVIVLAGALLYVTRPFGVARLFEARGPSGQARLYLWGIALSALRDHPWLGTGFDTFAEVYHRYLPETAVYRESDPPTAHNIYLNMFVEGGVVGGMAFLVVVFAAARIGWLHVMQRDDAEAAGFFAAYCAVLAREFIDGTILSFHLGLGFMMMLAIIAAFPARARLLEAFPRGNGGPG